jgi:hypothetical protein
MSLASRSETTARPDYEQRLREDRRWAMDEGDRFFQKSDSVFQTLRAIARRLDDLGVPYAVAGGMALNAHGFRRLTVDVDILVTREGLRTIHERLDGLGYLPPFAQSKNLRDTDTGVRVEFLIAGDYPGDGKPKPIAFPDPATIGVTIDGVRYLDLVSLVELKLASGMTGGVHRLKDLADVVALIDALSLDEHLADRMNPFVRDRYVELHRAAQEGKREP